MLDILVFLLSLIAPIFAVLFIASLYLLLRTVSDAVDPTYKLKEISLADRQFLRDLFKRIKLLRDFESYCELTESGIYCELSKDELENRVYWRRQIRFYLTALVFGGLTAYFFNSMIVTFSIVAVVFFSSIIDRRFIKVVINNMDLLKD